MKSMKMALIALIAASAGFAPMASASPALASPSQGTGMICLTGGTSASCSVDRATGAATLDTTASGSFASVYSASSTSSARTPVGQVSFSFTYNCTSTTNCEAGGSPRWSIPIATGKGGTAGFAFVLWNYCASAGATSGTVGSNCGVDYGSAHYSDWEAFASANPTFTIGTGGAFMVADQPFQGTISNFQFSG